MSRDVLTIGSTMRIPLLYRGEYSQWVERFMNYLKEQTDGEVMINSIKNGDQPLPRVTQVSIAGTTSTEQPPLKDKSMWSDQEKRVENIDRLARSLLIQGLLNDIYSLIDSTKTAKDLWDALARHMLGFEYGEQDRKTVVLYEYETFKATERELLLDTYIRYLQNKNLMDINIDALYNILKQNQGDVNDAMGSKKKTVVVTSDPLGLIADKTNVSKSKEKVVVSLDFKGSEADDFSELKKITALLAKAFNQRKFYSKPTNNNLRISSSSQSANKKQEFVKTDDKKVEKKADEKKRDMSRVKCYNCKKEEHFAKDCKKAKEINENMVFMAQIEKVLSDSEASSSSTDEKIYEIVQICLWIIDSGCSKHITGNHALLMNFMEKFLGTIRFGNNDFAVIASYGDVVIVASNSSTCLLAKASSSQSWLWHQCLSHLNFATINNRVKNNLVQGLPKMKFEKIHLCSACEQGKIHRKHHKSKTAFASNKPLYLLHMDLYGPMRIQSINGKRYVLVVVDDYSRYTWVFVLHSKDEASEVIISFIKKTQVNLQLQVQRVRTDNGTKFKNKTLAKFFDEVGITQQFSAVRMPQQNGFVERRNRTLVEAARTMLTFANLPSFLWAEAIATACFTENHSIIHKRFDKTPYELINKRKPNIKFFCVFGCRCYFSMSMRMLENSRQRGILECFLEPGLSNLNKTGKSSNPSVSNVDEASKKDLEDLFQDFYDEYFNSSKVMKSSTTNVDTPIIEEVFHEVFESFQGESSSSSLKDDVQHSPEEDAYFDASTSFHDPSNVHTNYQPYPHEKKWTKDHPLHKIIGDPKSSVRTRGQLANSCLFSCLLSSIEPANVAEHLRDADWVSPMQEELDQFARLKVWRLIPRPEGKSVIKTKWIFKNKKDESSLVIRNKARLVAVGYFQQEGIDYDETIPPVARIEPYACSWHMLLIRISQSFKWTLRQRF
uniref:Retrovirus-related Pol polyprotein from transposon TNT 1-94 n=1 Tax=Tanacetum cinerariifolium TaxID=118510 RepID=A0A699H858_TANCI|nr:hypothetical protein [Tanacetum cinerariifolium]